MSDRSIPRIGGGRFRAVLLAGALWAAGCGEDGLGPSGAPRFVAIAAGGDHTCALAEDGTAWCWGSDTRGQLGDGAPVGEPRAVPVRVAGGLAFVSLALGEHHSCGIAGGGEAYCWGSGGYG